MPQAPAVAAAGHSLTQVRYPVGKGPVHGWYDMQLISKPVTGLAAVAVHARAGALVGAAAGLGVAAVVGVQAARGKRPADSPGGSTEALTEIGSGAILGAVGAVAAGLTGAGVAALVGRGLPTVMSTAAAAAVHEPVRRLSRRAAENVTARVRRPVRLAPARLTKQAP